VNSPLQRGERHQDTIQLKKDLKAIGYPVPGSGTNLYGVQTEVVVKKFQKEQGLIVNGIADSITLNKIKSLNKPAVDPNNLKNGDRHAKVKTLKRDLAKVGFPVPGSGTDLFGTQTEKQVRAFQRY